MARSLDESLARLQTSYVDLYLMHWPLAFERTDDYEIRSREDGKPVVNEELSSNHEPTWRAMEELVRRGKTRAIGVSNFNIEQLKRLLSFARIKPVCNQVEAHPWLPQKELLDFCRENDIAFVAYSPLGSQSGPKTMHTLTARLLEDETVRLRSRDPANKLSRLILSTGCGSCSATEDWAGTGPTGLGK